MRKPKVGDYITVKTTSRSGTKTIRRKVVHVDWNAPPGHQLGIRHDGWNPYYISKGLGDKITKVEKGVKM